VAPSVRLMMKSWAI